MKGKDAEGPGANPGPFCILPVLIFLTQSHRVTEFRTLDLCDSVSLCEIFLDFSVAR